MQELKHAHEFSESTRNGEVVVTTLSSHDLYDRLRGFLLPGRAEDTKLNSDGKETNQDRDDVGRVS